MSAGLALLVFVLACGLAAALVGACGQLRTAGRVARDLDRRRSGQR